MIDYMRIINDAKVALMAEYEHFEAQQHLDRGDEDRMAAVSAQIHILNKVHAEMLRQENVALDQQYLAHRSRGLGGEDSLQADFAESAMKPDAGVIPCTACGRPCRQDEIVAVRGAHVFCEVCRDMIQCTGCGGFFVPDDIVYVFNDQRCCAECDAVRPERFG